MRKIRLFSVFALLALCVTLALGVPEEALAGPPGPPPGLPGPDDLPSCAAMPEAQIPGTTPGSACRVPVASLPGTPVGSNIDSVRLFTLYRSGWTHQWASESDSDLVEDWMKVEGWLYQVVGDDEYYQTKCEDSDTHTSHRGCRNTGTAGQWHQNGRHYFHTDGYVDDYFQTDDYWTAS